MFRKSLFGSAIRAGFHRQVSEVCGSGSDRSFHAFSKISQNSHAFTGSIVHHKPSVVGNLGMKLGLVRAYEAGRFPRSPNYGEGFVQDRYPGGGGPYPMYQPPQLETNADVVHIKLMRNNAFVTVTDSKGNRKTGVSAGKLAGKAGKLGRYAGEAASEEIGRRVRQMKTKSVVVKVSGFTFFRRKKEAILAFKDGYTNSRGDMNPVVYIEDTTRKPHNGCRRRKQRRI